MRVKHHFAAQVVTDPAEAMRRAVYGAGVLEAGADSVGVSHQTLSKQLNEIDGNSLSLRRAAALDQFVGKDALAHCFAARSGGVFLKLPEVTGSLAELAAGYSRLITAEAEASKAFSTAIADGKMTQQEVDRLEAELREVAVAGANLVRLARTKVGHGA